MFLLPSPSSIKDIPPSGMCSRTSFSFAYLLTELGLQPPRSPANNRYNEAAATPVAIQPTVCLVGASPVQPTGVVAVKRTITLSIATEIVSSPIHFLPDRYSRSLSVTLPGILPAEDR